jgi:hypothetical protein
MRTGFNWLARCSSGGLACEHDDGLQGLLKFGEFLDLATVSFSLILLHVVTLIVWGGCFYCKYGLMSQPLRVMMKCAYGTLLVIMIST